MGQAIPVLDHRRSFIGRIHMHERAGHMAKKGLAGKQKHDRAVFANRPQHAQALEFSIRFAQDLNTLCCKLIKLIH